MEKNVRPTRTPSSSKWSSSTPGGGSLARTVATPPVVHSYPSRTPTLSARETDSQKSTPRSLAHTMTPQSARAMASHSSRAHLPFSGSKSATSSARLGSVSNSKKLKADSESHVLDSGSAHLGLHHSRHERDKDGARNEEEGKRSSLNRILSFNSLNVPTPMRTKHPRLSSDSKAPTPVRSSVGRSVVPSKLSLGSATPTPRRRSSSSIQHHRHSSHSYMPLGGSTQVTPEVIVTSPSRLSWSERQDNQYGKPESTKVSVGVRIRPFSVWEQSSSESKNILEVHGNNMKVCSEAGTSHTFNYDHCLWSSDKTHPRFASQEDVYTTLARPLLEKAYEGYNTCLFAYGQTGSGKSYTMLGEDCLSEVKADITDSAGVIPRFCQELFDTADRLHAQNPPENQLPQCNIEVEVSYIEIYNERIYDLLSSGGGEKREALRVREHPDTGPYVEGVASHLVTSYHTLASWLWVGNRERSIAATGLNDKSSRSHAVFTIKLTQTQVEDVEGEKLESSRVSIINLVDLAGSERLAASHSEGDRLKEGVCINKSLFTLGKVITALAESEGCRRTFIPYRESVLTYLLKESLGGNSRTAMIATVSPCSTHLEETLSTLRYAQKARKIINHNYINEDPTALIIRSLKEEVERLRLQQVQKSPSFLFESEDPPEAPSQDVSMREVAAREKEAVEEKEREMARIIKEKEDEIIALRDEVRFHKLLSAKSKSLEDRVKETEAQRLQALESLHRSGIAEENERGPVLINLNEDPQLTETLSYRLQPGTTTLGRSSCHLSLRGLHSEQAHCSISNNEGNLKLYPSEEADTFVNGKQVKSLQTLHHMDRLVLAGLYYFLISCPNKHNTSNTKNNSIAKTNTKKMDFYFARDELLKEQEKRLQRETELAVAASKAEMEREMQSQMEQLRENISEARNQLLDREDKVNRLEGDHWKLSEEKRLLEEQIRRTRQNSLNASLPPPQPLNSNLLNEIESIFNESMQEVKREEPAATEPMLGFKLKEANKICKKLGKPYEFMIQQVLSESGIEGVVLVKDLHHQMTATLSTTAFNHKLQLLRDIIQGEASEGAVFEGGLSWERLDDVTTVPGFINRLLDCTAQHNINASLNFSLNNTSMLHLRPGHNRRRNSILPSVSQVENPTPSSVTLATTLHQVWENLPSHNPQTHPTAAALDAVATLHHTGKILRDHITEPGESVSEGELSRVLVELLCQSQTATSCVLNLTHTDHTDDSTSSTEVVNKLSGNIVEVSTCVSRIYQGVKTEVESLVEEASGVLISLTNTIVTHIATLTVITHSTMPHLTNIKPGTTLYTKFSDGLKIGLNFVLKKACNAVESSRNHCSRPHTPAHRSQDVSTLMAATLTASEDIATLLKQFMHHIDMVDYSEAVCEEQRLNHLQWMNRVVLAADTVTTMEGAFTHVVQQVQSSPSGQLKEEAFKNSTDELINSLQQVKSYSGVRLSQTHRDDDTSLSSLSSSGSTIKQVKYYASMSLSQKYGDDDTSLSSLSSKGSNNDNKDSLTTLVNIAVESVKALQKSANSNCVSSKNKAIGYNKKVLTNWPTNSSEYQRYLQAASDHRKRQMKSSIRDSGAAIEEKRVRFDFNSTSSTSEFFDETIDI